ncbi:hypothetical protein, partial [Tessaracoccus defluvii]
VAGSTQTNVWNPDGSLASVSAGSQVSRFVYSAAGSEVLRTDPAGTTLFLGGMDLVLSGSTVKATRYYSYDGQTIAQRSPDGVRAFFSDQVGTSHTAIDWGNLATVTRRVSDPYGVG